MIRITSKKDGFRRAGLSHSGVKEYPSEFFTDQQLVLLRSEPLLLVEEVTEEEHKMPGGEETVSVEPSGESTTPGKGTLKKSK